MNKDLNRYRAEEEELEKKGEKTAENPAINSTNDEKEAVVEVDKKEEPNKKSKGKENEKEYQELTNKFLAIQDKYLRSLAEMDNYKKRSIEERTRERKYMYQDILLDLVNVIDIFDKAVSVKTEDDKLKNYLIGFTMINQQLKQILSDYQVKKIESLNKPFDPTCENAMEVEVNDDIDEDIVVKEIMSGYLYKDRVLRPAHVIVSKHSTSKKKEETTEDTKK